MGLAYEIRYHPKVETEDIEKLSHEMRRRIRETIEMKLMAEPELYSIPLRGTLKGHRKLRVGDYRVVFYLEKKTIFVLAILHRSVVYGRTERRV